MRMSQERIQNRDTAQQSSSMVERVARVRRFIEMRKRIASPGAADEQRLIADLEATAAEASHHAELVEALTNLMRRVDHWFDGDEREWGADVALLTKIGGAS